MKKVVISLGGSQIIKNNEINLKFLKNFRKIILKNSKEWKFVVVCGGGSVARMYIRGLKKSGKNEILQSFAGISVTRTNARFMSYFFGNENIDGVPSRMREVKRKLRRENLVFCGALEYEPNQTSDSTSAQIAKKLGCEFINITNIDGLYTSNPLKDKKAKFIPQTSWEEFYKRAMKIPFKPGQHFVLDQKAAKIIMDNKIKTYIIGTDLRNLDKILKSKKFRGTSIYN